VDKLTLTRTRAGTWSGHGHFFFSLRCAGIVYKHGGEAKFKITVTITSATTIQTEPFATDIKARYSNAHRINHTECGGDLGRDGANYTGKVKSLPGPPSADFDASPGPNHSESFTDRSTRGAGNSPIAKRHWDFGDGGTSSERNPSHTYAAPGPYTVSLTVTDQNGLTDTATRQIVVAR
jgi:PKD repeat protein